MDNKGLTFPSRKIKETHLDSFGPDFICAGYKTNTLKQLVLLFALALVCCGCSPNSDGSSKQSPSALAADLGKSEAYFVGLYGSPKADSRVAEFSFSLPGHGKMIPLTRTFIVQNYESDKLKAKVLLHESTRRAVWANYTLPDPWTQEQISAALKAYGSDWKIVQESLGRSLILQARAPVAYRDSNGCLAYKTMVNELIVYAPQLQADLRAQIDGVERQKKAVLRARLQSWRPICRVAEFLIVGARPFFS